MPTTAYHFQCPDCGADLGRCEVGTTGKREVDCPRCGHRCTLCTAIRQVPTVGTKLAIKVVKTGTAATMRHV